MIPLHEKFPNESERILNARSAGWSDQKILKVLQLKAAKMRYEGKSKEEVEEYFGITNKTKMESIQDRHNELMDFAPLYGYSKDAQKKAESFAREKLGLEGEGLQKYMSTTVAPWTKFVNWLTRDVKTAEKRDFDNFSDFVGMLSVGGGETYVDDPYSWKHLLGYGLTKLPWEMQKQGMNILSLPWQVAEVTERVVTGGNSSWVGDYISEQLDFYRNLEDHFALGKYVQAIENSRLAIAEGGGPAAKIFEQIYQLGLDFASMIGGFKVFSAFAADTVNAGRGLYLSTKLADKVAPALTKTDLGVAPKPISFLRSLGEKAALHGTHAFLTTDGELEDRVYSGLYRIAYNMTPYVAGAIGNQPWGKFSAGFGAVWTDFFLNSMLTSNQYWELYKRTGGDPWLFAQEAIPQVVLDFGMSWSTRGEPQNIRAAMQRKEARYMSTLQGRSYDDALRMIEERDSRVESALKKVEDARIEREETYKLVDGWIPKKELTDSAKREQLVEKIINQRNILGMSEVPRKPMWEMTREEFGKFIKSEGLKEDILRTEGTKAATGEEAKIAKEAVEATAKEAEKAYKEAYEAEVLMQHGEDAMVYYDMTEAIRKEGGLRWDSLVNWYGKDDATKIKKLLGPGGVKKNGLPVDKMLQVLHSRGIAIGDENDLHASFIYRRPKFSKKDAQKMMRGEGPSLDPFKTDLHYQVVKAAVDKGVRVPIEVSKPYPDIHMDNISNWKVPNATEVRSNPEAAAKAIKTLVGRDTTVEEIVRGGPKKIGAEDKKLNERIYKQTYKALRTVVDELIHASNDKVKAEYRNEIDAMLDDLDLPSKGLTISARKKAIREEMVEADINDPTFRDRIDEKDAQLLNRRPLNDIPVSVLMDRYLAVKDIQKAGIEAKQKWLAERDGNIKEIQWDLYKNELEGDRRQREAKERLERFEKESKELFEPIILDKAFDPEEMSYFKKMRMKAKGVAARPARIFDMLDGYKDFTGRFVRFFVDGADRAEDTKLQYIDYRQSDIARMLKKHNLSVKALGKTRDLPIFDASGQKFEFTLDHLLSIYAYWQNPHSRLALMLGWGIGEKQFEQIEKHLSSNEKAFAWDIIGEYNKHFDRINKALMNYVDRQMVKEENYVRMYYEHRPDSNDTFDDFVTGVEMESARINTLRQMYVKRGMTYARKNLGKNRDFVLRLGLLENWQKSVIEAEHFHAYADLVRQFQSLLGKSGTKEEPKLAKEIEKLYGREVKEALRDWVNRLAVPDYYKSRQIMDSWWRLVRENMGIAYLAGNLVTMLKQLPSFLLYSAEAGPSRVLGAAFDVMTDWHSARALVERLDPQMKHRSIENVLEELKSSDPRGSIRRAIKAGGAPLMGGIAFFDKVATTIGWIAVYEKYRDMGWSMEAAAHRAQRITLNTQPAAHAKELPAMYTQSEFVRTFLIFTNQLNNIWNITTHDLYGYGKNKQYSKLAAQIIALALSGTMIQALARHEVPETPLDVLEGFEYQTINSIPFFGKAISGVREGFKANSDPFSMLGYRAGQIYEWAVNPKKRREFPADSALEVLALLMGTPYTGPKRLFQALDQGNIGILFGERPSKRKGVKLF